MGYKRLIVRPAVYPSRARCSSDFVDNKIPVSVLSLSVWLTFTITSASGGANPRLPCSDTQPPTGLPSPHLVITLVRRMRQAMGKRVGKQ